MRGRLSRLATAALGAAIVGLVGSGLFATVVDTATSEANSVTSNAITEGALLKAGILTDGQTCSIENVSDVTTFAALFESGAITLTRGNGLMSKRVCLYNAGGQAAALRMTVANLVDLEANTTPGTCDGTEANPDGGNDQTCGVGAAGELSELLDLTIRQDCPVGQECMQPPPPPTFDEWVAAGPVTLATLNPGQFIEKTFLVIIDQDATDQQIKAAQTDRLQWDFVFDLNQ